MRLKNSPYNRILRHIIFWILCYLALTIEDYTFYPNWRRSFAVNFINVIFFIPILYTNLYKLIPKLLFQGRYFFYTLISGVAIAAIVSLINFFNFYFFNSPYYLSDRAFIAVITELIAIYTFTTALKFIQMYYVSESQLKELHNENLRIELNLLKNQVNPHFLFNTLNNIYFLAGKNSEQMQDAVLKLSELLSYQLYNNKEELVSLNQELDNLKNYIELEQLRVEDTVIVKAVLTTDVTNKKIAPMLLLPLVENAFKHGTDLVIDNPEINIQAVIDNNRLKFTCDNFFRNKTTEISLKGIGLQNVQRRLELLYNGKHDFTVIKKNNTFSVYLSIQLNED